MIGVPAAIRTLASHRTALLLVINLGLNAIGQYPVFTEQPQFALLNVITTSSVIAIGRKVARTSEVLRNLGNVCVIVGLLWSFQWIATYNRGIGPAFGAEANIWVFVIAAIGMLRTAPIQPLKRDRLSVSFVTMAMVTNLEMLVSRPEWYGYSSDSMWPTVVADDFLFKTLTTLPGLAWVVFACLFCRKIFMLLQRLSVLDRKIATPVVLGFCCTGLIAGISSVTQLFPPVTWDMSFTIVTLSLLVVPLGFVGATVTRRVQRAVLAERFNKKLSRQVITGSLLVREMRNTLDDQALELLYWVDDAYRTADGKIVDASSVLNLLLAHVKDSDGQSVALVASETALFADADMLSSLIDATYIALKHVQLQTSIAVQLEEVRDSRARILSATLGERKRIERNLHDGVQQRLLAIQAKIGVIQRDGTKNADVEFAQLSKELSDTLSALRDLVRGINPPELAQFGIKGAVEVAIESLPIPITLDITSKRFSSAIEANLYFIICEALNNIVKHSSARGATVVVRDEGGTANLQISDDGIGGANLKPGGGLEGLSDRLRSLGGELSCTSLPGEGTKLASTVPLS